MVILPQYTVSRRASSMTFCFACSEVYGNEKKCTGIRRTPRFAII